MEIEKVIRIIAITLVIAAFAIRVATRIMFPESSSVTTLPITIILILCLSNIWRQTDKKHKNSNE